MIKIYDINDKLLMQAEVTSAAKREQEMSKSDYISLSFSAAEKVILPVGAYINYTYKIDKVREVTRKFLLLESYEPIQTDECSWKYTPQFQHPKMILSKTPFFIYTRNSQNVEVKQNVWSFVGTTSVLSGKIADFLNKDLMFGECGWKVIFQNVTANTVNVSFSDNDFISALTAITNAIGDNCEWHIDYDDEIIYIGKVLIGATPVFLEVGKNVGVPNISNSKESYYNAFSIFGGTRNITQVNSKGENVSSGDIRLQLDEGNGTISIDGKERSYSIDKYSTLDLRVDKINEPLFTKVLDFSQIFPSLNTYVYNVRGRVKYVLDENNEKIPISYNADGSIKEYKTFTVWYMRLAYPTTEKVEGKTIINTTVDDGVTHYWYDFQITDNLLINGKNIGCSFEANFNTGALSTSLAGRGSNGEYVGFELTYHKEASSSHTSDDVSDSNFSVLAGDYEIIYQEDNEVIIPTNAADMLIPRGESMPSLKCNITVLYNIAMSDSIYYEDAQNRLLEKAKEGIVRLLSDLNNYEIKSYSDVFLEENPELQIGQSVTYKDGHGYELATRVLKLSTNIDFGFIQTITLGNQVIKGTITQLKEDVQTIIASGGSSGNGGGYSVSQLRNIIAKYGSDNFLSKQFDDTAKGTIIWEKVQKLLSGLLVGNFNSENGGSWTPDTEGRSHLITDYLEVRMKAIFEEIVVKKTSTIGGKEIISPAGGVVAHKVKEVTVTYNNVSQKAYRCYFLAEQEGDSVDNDFAVNDQVRSESFNVRKGTYHKVGNHFYWRLVIGRDEEPVELEGKKYHYIDLSDTDCATASDVPAKGDVLNQCGNTTDVERQNCLIFSAVDTYSPSISLYHGINSYSFANKEYVEYGVNKQNNKAFFNVYGDMYVGDRPTKENGYEGSSYIRYDSSTKQVSVKGKISSKSTVDGKELSQYIKENSAKGLTEEQVNNLIKNSQVIADLQNQVDGAIETWFYDGVPTLENAPASSWTSDKDKDTHLGDLYYDNKTGKAYRFAKDGNTYKWTIIADTDIAKALSDASKAQETADGKMKVFSAQPIPPYQLGDIWVNATYPTDGRIYKNEILRCQTAKAKGSSFAIADWTKASKYTDDSALNTFKEEYKNDMASYKEQLDEKVETWFYNYAPTTQNKPAFDWTTDTLKSQHAGDLFYNTSNGYTYRWTGTAWARIKDNDINTAMTAASKAQDTADGKRTVFTSQPTVPYDEGDLWASGGDDGKTLMVCVKSRATGSFTSSEWVKANDSDLNAFAKTIEESLTGIRDQLDKKAETWYQSTDPSTSWTTDDAKKKHKGDLWYNTSNNQTFFWNGTKWDKQDVPTEVFDKIDGKSSIYVSKPASYEERDLWILEASYTLGGVAYSKGELVVATKTNASFSAADWTKKVKYTDDTVANAAKAAAEKAQKAAETAQTNVTNLGKTVTSNKKAFDSYVSDGYLEPSEIAAMAQDSKRLEDAFAAAEKSYNEVKGAEVLKSTKELTNLNTAFATLTTAKTELVTYLSDISARYNAADTKGKATIVSAVGTKFTNFQSAYSAFYDKLGLANAYITSKIYGDLKQNITDLAGYKYIKDALGQTTDIDGGLVMTTLLALRDADGNVQSGINGAIDPNRGKKSIATWWGGQMVDKDYNSGSLTPATSLVRFDGTGYLANGAIWWDVDGKVHADPTSFIISEKNLGAYLAFFEPTWKSGSNGTNIKDLVALTPQAPFTTLSVSNDLLVEGKLKLGSITLSVVNGALKIDGNVYSTGGMSAYGDGTNNGGGGGLVASVKSYTDIIKGTYTDNDLASIPNAYAIKALSNRIDNISSELGGLSLDWANITGKPSTFTPSAHTHKWVDITDRITKVSQLTNDSGYTTNKGTVTSVKLTLPTGLSLGTTKEITTSGTFAISLTSGYSIPTTSKQGQWDSAYNWYKLMTTDEKTADGVINKWNEVVDFLAGIAQTDSLDSILSGINKSITDETNRAKKAEGANATNIATNKANITTLQGYFTNGSAKSAIKLTNARKLWGNSFDGTADISGSIVVPSGKYITIGNIKLEYDAANKALKITNTTTNEVANLYTSGGVSAYGVGTTSSGSTGGGGLVASVKSYTDIIKGTYTDNDLASIPNAYAIKALSSRIDNIATELGGLNLSWNNITGKPSTFSPSAHTHKWTEITDRITKVSQLTNDAGYLTAHQSLASYYTKAEIDAKGYTTNKGTVTSVALTLPTGLACTTKTITTSGTFAISLASGYSIPTTTKQTAWDGAVSAKHTHSNKSVLDGISSAKVAHWDSAYDWYALMTTDEETADGIINKWNEVVSFLANIAQTDTLSGIVDGINKSISDEVTRAKKAEGLNASGISTNKANITTLQGYFTSGSAKKALQLTNARKLWGNSFNGTSDINGSIIVPNGKYISIGNIKMEYDATNKALKITNTTTNEVANLYTSGGISAYGVGTSSSSGGGLNGSVKAYADSIKLTSENLSEIASAYSIAVLNNSLNAAIGRISTLEGGSATSIETTGSGNAVTSVSKSGTKITFTKGSTFSLNGHTHDFITVGARQTITATQYRTNGLSVRPYYNSGGPTTYGNILEVVSGISGGGQLGMEWSGRQTKTDGTDTNVGKLYYRSKRDYIAGWTVWKRLAFAEELAWGNISGKPTSLSGYGITDGVNAVSVTGSGNAVTAASVSGHTLTLTKGSTFSLSGHTHTFASLTSKPTTIAGYGITDAYTKAQVDAIAAKYLPLTGGTLTGQLKIVASALNGAYNGLLIGDNCYIGDCNLGNTIGLMGVGNHNAGMVKFGKGGMQFGYNGSNHIASTTAQWTNLNADLLDGWHKDNIVWSGAVNSNTASLSHYWAKLFDITVTGNQYDDRSFTFLFSNGFNDTYSVVVLRIRQNGAKDSGAYNFNISLRELVGNMSSRLRVYYNNATGNVQLWGNCQGQYGSLSYTIIKKTGRTSADFTSQGTLVTNTSFSAAQSLPATTGDSPYTLLDGATRIGIVKQADQLVTARSLWGQSFNGTANVSGNLTGVGNINTSAAPAGTIYTNNWFRSKGSTGWYSEDHGGGWYMSDNTWIRNFGSKDVYLSNRLSVNGNVGIGTTDPSHKLHVLGEIYTTTKVNINGIILEKDSNGDLKVNGNLYATGGISAYGASDGTSSSGGLNGSVKSYADALKLTSESLSEIASAYSIKALDSRISSLEGGSATAISVSGSGNAVTSISKSGTTISVVKGSTFLTAHQSLAGYMKTATADAKYMYHSRNNIVSDLNSFATNGAAHIYEMNNVTNRPNSNSWVQVMNWGTGDSDYGFLLANDYATNGHMYFRQKIAGSWKDWKTIIDSSNIGSQSVNYAASAGSVAWTNVSGRPSTMKNPSALSWSGYSSGSYDGSAAKSISIPNNTNQLTNGAGFITASASITGNAATATKVNHSLSVFGKSFNGSADVTVADTDLIASISTATANLTDKTEILTSYASDNGFNDSNAKNRIYRRPASAIWGYINSKTISNADKLDGVHASGLFTNLSNSGNNISITIGGTNKTLTAAYATNCDTVDGYHAQLGSSKPYGKIPVIGTDGVIELGHYIDFHHDNTTGSDYSVRLQTNGNHSNVVTLPTATGTLALTSDNVASATKLQTTRTLWGQSFNGTANISGSMTGVGDMTLDAGARIKHGSGNLYIGNSDNSNWIGVQDICSQSSIGDGNWSLRTSGAAHFKDTTINGTATIKNLLSLVDGSHKGLKMGSTYISSLDGEVILQGNTALRFGNDAWDYNQWAGLKYDHSSKTVYLGIADGSIFKANSAQSGGVINLKQGISSVYTPELYAGGDIYHTGVYRMLWKNSKASKYLNVMNISQDDNGILTIGYGNFSNNKNVVLEGYNLNFRVGNDSGMKSMWLNYNNGNPVLSLDGNFYATGGVTAYKSSDERLKHDIHGVDSLAIIKAMGGTVAFRYNADNKDSIGWIAQRVLHNTFMQDIVETDEKGYYKINYWSPKLIATAFGAIEQVGDEVSRLKARVVFLESEVQRLSGKQDSSDKKRLDNKNINLLN